MFQTLTSSQWPVNFPPTASRRWGVVSAPPDEWSGSRADSLPLCWPALSIAWKDGHWTNNANDHPQLSCLSPFFFFLNKIYSVVVCVAVGTGYKHTGDPKSRATEGEESQRCDNCLRLAIWSRKYQRADPTSQRSKIKLVPSRLNCNQTRIQCFDQVNWTHGSLPGIPFLIMYNFLLRKFFWNRN